MLFGLANLAQLAARVVGAQGLEVVDVGCDSSIQAVTRSQSSPPPSMHFSELWMRWHPCPDRWLCSGNA